jgi:hypothetical protein
MAIYEGKYFDEMDIGVKIAVYPKSCRHIA